MEQEYPTDIQQWTLERFVTFLAENGGSEVGDVAISLVHRGLPALELAQRIEPDDAYGLVSALATEYNPATAQDVEVILEALLTRVDINRTSSGYDAWDGGPEQTKSLLGEVAYALEPKLVRFLLARGADPMVARAEALNASLYATSQRGRRGARGKAREIVVLLLRAGLSPRLFHRDQVTYLFNSVDGLALLRVPPVVRDQLPGVDGRLLRMTGAALEAVVGRHLAGYLQAAL